MNVQSCIYQFNNDGFIKLDSDNDYSVLRIDLIFGRHNFANYKGELGIIIQDEEKILYKDRILCDKFGKAKIGKYKITNCAIPLKLELKKDNKYIIAINMPHDYKYMEKLCALGLVYN